MKWKTWLLEILLIVFGVLIAFWLNNLGERQRTRRLKEKVLATIEQEISNNRQILHTHLDRQDSLLHRLTDRVRETAASGGGEINFSVTKLLLNDTGYELAKNTGILNDIDFDLLFAVAEYYSEQEEVENMQGKVLEQVFTGGVTDSLGFDRLLTQLRVINENGHNLLRSQEVVLGKMEKASKGKRIKAATAKAESDK